MESTEQFPLAKAYLAMWDRPGGSPQARTFLAAHPDATAEERLQVLLVDQERRWRGGIGQLVEEYLEEFPDIAADEQLVLPLVLKEWEHLSRRGEVMELDSILSRYPGLGQHLLPEAQSTQDHNPVARQETDGEPAHDGHDGADALPERIGRFVIQRVLGRGGFGIVYLARDPDLDREVALKVPRLDRFGTDAQLELFVDEARKAAQLEHPGIVRVLDVQRDPQLVYVVQRYVPGGDVTQLARSGRLPPRRVAELMIAIADAVGFAHQRGFIHLDLKPANILLDDEGHPQVADFGLALHESKQREMAGAIAGTYPYMSPEQTRGEAHRLDGRSDIWSLGVILYELLTGRRPFVGDTKDHLVDEIRHRDAKPPRMIDPQLPPELSRICLACLAKRATDRCQSMADLIDDLKHWLEEQAAGEAGENAAQADVKQAEKIIPQGLRSFGPEHADFYPELLEGPHDREGLPQGVRFWKTQIEQTDPDETFSVGVLYGPSGCGKSSLMKAGVLPRLDKDDVLPINVESTAADTEVRLLKVLKKNCLELPADANVTDLVAQLRSQGGSRGRKVLIVLDQFEQWLHAHEARDDSQLLPALRQCDGAGVQCLVMVRDDFWMSLTRFMDALEVPIVQGHNAAAVDRFHLKHAAKVLTAFGRAYDLIPQLPAEPSPEQTEFVKQAVDGLAEEGKVICVRLAVFAEMMKSRPWTPASLKDVGGAEGVGVTFLEETFNAKTAPMAHRQHEKAVRAVLKAMLPETGTDIKAEMQSHDSLLEASGYQQRPGDFDALLRILDSEVRLITPTEPDEPTEAGSEPAADDARHYQLTHDFLVLSLREWLTRKQKETRRGRAELKLADRAALWNAKQENRHLPSVLEWLNIRCLSDVKHWNEPQRNMMRKAASFHAKVWGITIAVLIAASISLQYYVTSYKRQADTDRVVTAIDNLQKLSGETIPFAIRELKLLPDDLVLAELRARLPSSEGRRKLAVGYALAAYDQIEIGALVGGVGDAGEDDCDNLVEALRGADGDALKAKLGEQAIQATAKQDWVLKARLALLALHLGDASVASDVHRITDRPDPAQQTVFIHDAFPTWHGNLANLAQQMRNADDAAVQAGICLAIGDLKDVDGVKPTWEELLSHWYAESPESGLHGSAGWALRQWGVARPELPPDTADPPGRDWKVTPHGFTMVRIPHGQFQRTDGETTQIVTLTRDFWLSDVEVSAGLFQQFMDDPDYSGLKPKGWDGVETRVSPTAAHPAQQVSWEDAVLFCNWLSRQDGRTACYKVEEIADAKPVDRQTLSVEFVLNGTGYRLPTEAEWEYACRAGTTTEFGFGDNASRLPEYGIVDANKAEPQGSKMCNRWGLFDMHGNVSEFCWDWYGNYETDAVRDPLGSLQGFRRVYRGGSWSSTARYCRSSFHFWFNPSYRDLNLGFRVALVPSRPASQEQEPAGGGADSAGR